jgi:hypothetical protein
VHTIVKKYGEMIGVDIHPHTFRHNLPSTGTTESGSQEIAALAGAQQPGSDAGIPPV